MKKKAIAHPSIVLALGVFAFLTLGLMGCTSATTTTPLASPGPTATPVPSATPKPTATPVQSPTPLSAPSIGLTLSVDTSAAGGLVGDPVVTGGSVIIMAYDSAAPYTYRGTSGALTKGSTSYSGTITPTAFGTLRFRAFVKNSAKNFVYYGEVTQVVDSTTTALTAITVAPKITLAAVNLDTATSTSSGSTGAAGGAGYYAILAETTVTSVGSSVITGNVAVSPNNQASLTGFSLTGVDADVFRLSSQVTGNLYGANPVFPLRPT